MTRFSPVILCFGVTLIFLGANAETQTDPFLVGQGDPQQPQQPQPSNGTANTSAMPEVEEQHELRKRSIVMPHRSTFSHRYDNVGLKLHVSSEKGEFQKTFESRVFAVNRNGLLYVEMNHDELEAITSLDHKLLHNFKDDAFIGQTQDKKYWLMIDFKAVKNQGYEFDARMRNSKSWVIVFHNGSKKAIRIKINFKTEQTKGTFQALMEALA